MPGADHPLRPLLGTPLIRLRIQCNANSVPSASTRTTSETKREIIRKVLEGRNVSIDILEYQNSEYPREFRGLLIVLHSCEVLIRARSIDVEKRTINVDSRAQVHRREHPNLRSRITSNIHQDCLEENHGLDGK